MTRSDIGRLFSKALAIWMLLGTTSHIATFAALIKQEHLDRSVSVLLTISLTVRVAVILLLWFKASGFGSWNEAEAEPIAYEWHKINVATAAIQAASLFWLLNGVANFLTSVETNMPKSEDYIRLVGLYTTSGWGDILLIVVASLALAFAKPLSRFL